MLVKVCGMRYGINIKGLCEINPDYMGFIFYPKSPRYINGFLTPEIVETIPEHIIKTGVFVNEEESRILEFVSAFSLNAVQLHGSESPDFCQRIKSREIKVLKAFHLDGDESLKMTSEYQDVCDFFLFDTPSVEYGGTGRKFDWSILEKYNDPCPFFLSGGIGPGDVAVISQLKNIRLAGVDINSQFEIEPALKNLAEVKRFINQIRDGT